MNLIGASTGLPGLWTGIVIVSLLTIIAFWRIFHKAGRHGWAVIIPIYNTFTLIKVCQRTGWLLLLLFVPLVNVIVWIILMIDLARVFGKRGGYALGLIFLGPIFFWLLGFGGARYQGAEGLQA